MAIQRDDLRCLPMRKSYVLVRQVGLQGNPTWQRSLVTRKSNVADIEVPSKKPSAVVRKVCLQANPVWCLERFSYEESQGCGRTLISTRPPHVVIRHLRAQEQSTKYLGSLGLQGYSTWGREICRRGCWTWLLPHMGYLRTKHLAWQ